MANIKSQIKRNRQNEVRHQRNKAVRSRVKTFIKKFEETVATGDRDEAEAAFRRATSEVDTAVRKGVLHRNNAANQKARMARELNAL